MCRGMVVLNKHTPQRTSDLHLAMLSSGAVDVIRNPSVCPGQLEAPFANARAGLNNGERWSS